MVLLMLPLRAIYGLHDLITQRHIDNMCKICLGTGSIVGYAYIMEFFIAWYGANPYESFASLTAALARSGILHDVWVYKLRQLFWLSAVRRNAALVWVMSIFINVGMWFERFVITVTSSMTFYQAMGHFPTIVDIFTFVLFCLVYFSIVP